MTKINSYIGKFVFASIVIFVLYKEKIWPNEFCIEECVMLLLIGLIIWVLGIGLDQIQNEKRIKLAEEKKKKWIKSLYGKQ